MANTTATLLGTLAKPAGRCRDRICSYERTRKTIDRATTGQPAYPRRENSRGCSNSDRYLGLNEIVETHTCTSYIGEPCLLRPCVKELWDTKFRYHLSTLHPCHFYMPAW